MDRSGCEQLWQAHANTLLLYATTLLSDRTTAEDVLQVVFLRLISTNITLAPASETSYLIKAVRNEALTALRTRSRAKRAYEQMFESRSVNGRPGRPNEDRSFELERALLELPREQRDAVVLKIWSDLSFEEAAAVAEVTAKAFQHHYYRGLEALKNELDGKHEC